MNKPSWDKCLKFRRELYNILSESCFTSGFEKTEENKKLFESIVMCLTCNDTVTTQTIEKLSKALKVVEDMPDAKQIFTFRASIVVLTSKSEPEAKASIQKLFDDEAFRANMYLETDTEVYELNIDEDLEEENKT
jgi:hypothetical protein